jgi:histidinol phosphatase-like PHP family hydrolase
MKQQPSRREFLRTGAAAALSILSRRVKGATIDAASPGELDFPVIDFHAHPFEGNVPLERIIEVAKGRGVKLGVVDHGGFSLRLASDEALKQYIAKLAGYPVYKGMQAEGLDWMKCFSKKVVAQLDYVLSDAMIFPEKDGRRVRLWTPEAQIEDKQDFMERYVAFNVQVISEEPIDIFANPTYLPEALAAEYDALWTKARMMKVIEAAKKHGVAIEINSRFNIPSLAFLRMAKEAGTKFSFGSNLRDEDVGKLDYSVKMAKELGLTRKDMFMPAPASSKPILRRTFASKLKFDDGRLKEYAAAHPASGLVRWKES